MKLIMESWKRYLKEEREAIDPRLLPALAQDAMEVVAAARAKGLDMDVGSITLATMAQAGCDLPLIDMESVAEITLGDLFDKADLDDIMLGRAHSDNSEPQGALEELGQGSGMPPTTPPGDGFGDNDDGYDTERPLPGSWVGGKPPKPLAKKGKAQ